MHLITVDRKEEDNTKNNSSSIMGQALWLYTDIKGSPNNFFFLENSLKKLLNIFLNFFFYLKIQSFRLIMDNNFIQMAAAAGHAVGYTIGTIFKHIIDCVQLYFANGFTNIVF